MKRRVVLGLMTATLALAGGFAWLRLAPRRYVAIGEPLGQLPAGVRVESEPAARHARHDARRSHPRVRFDGDRDAEFRSARARRRAVRAGGRAGAADAAGALVDLHRASFRPRTACATTAASSSTIARRRSPNVCRTRGFTTGGFVGAYVLDHKWGIAQGFETYFDDFDLSEIPVALAGQRRSSRQRGRRQGARVARASSDRSGSSPGCISTMRTRRTTRRSRSSRGTQGGPYVGEIAFVDSQVGRLARVSRRATTSPDNTVVVVMGDHGESLGEHGEGTHGFFVYQATMHVPLLIRAPYRRDGRPPRGGSRSGASTSCRRRSNCSASAAERHLPGRSLVPLMTGAKKELGLAAYSEADLPAVPFRLERSARAAPPAATSTSPRRARSCTTWSRIRGSRRTSIAERQALGDRMQQELAAMEESMAAGARRRRRAVEVDPDARARLAALGYVGTFVATASTRSRRAGRSQGQDSAVQPDDRRRARLSRHDESPTRVCTRCSASIAEDPKVIDAWFMLGNEYDRRHEYTARHRAVHARSRTEARLRPRGHQHGERVPRARQRRGSHGRLPPLHGTGSEERPDSIRGRADPHRQRQAGRSRRGAQPRAGARAASWRPRATRWACWR